MKYLCLPIILLSGCAYGPMQAQWPTPPNKLALPFTPVPTKLAEISSVNSELTKLIDSAVKEGTNADKRDWSSGDMTSAGALLAGAGGLAGKTAMTNYGAGLAVLGLGSSTRYQFSRQEAAYAEAVKSFACIKNVLNSLSDKQQNWAIVEAPAKQKASAATAATDAIHYIELSRQHLIATLGSIASVPLTQEQILGWASRKATAMDDQQKLSFAPTSNGKAFMSSQATEDISSTEQVQAVQVLTSFKVDLEGCYNQLIHSGA
ncbi:hypothetical protein [Pseudomonas protegens]|uniref:hypothetical protein n=3 Tax=Pseudomonas protegens TaxID=380021 RepID=UPI001B329173|nr:hypothetical protein [Pseudomonas protegens]MBP5102119.1 hypothetical protein [Pseudomonas protegens]MBP5127355.1 hypothetical protein [Pseudomonas protegens]MBP5147862.1 hypothetical protein [Pseudomonas protegens]